MRSKWPETTVGAEFDIQLGKMLDAAQNRGALKRYIGNRAVQWGRIDLDASGLVPLDRREQGRFRLRVGDLLVCEGGEVGRAAIWNHESVECYYQKALHRLRPRRGYEARVMKALLELRASSAGFADFVTQTSIAHLPREKFLQLPIPSIPLGEQRRIAGVLEDADSLIFSLERLIGKKQAIKQGMMQQLLTSKTRLPGFSGEWQSKRLSELLDYEQPGRYLVSSTDYVRTGIPVLTAGKTFVLGHTTETGGVYEALPVIIFDDFTTASKYVSFPFKAKSSAMKMLSAKPDVNLRFVFERMQQIDFVAVDHKRRWIAEFSKLEIAVPPIEEQQAIAAVIEDTDDEIDLLERRLHSVRAIKQGMMQELLTGRTRLIPAEVAA